MYRTWLHKPVQLFCQGFDYDDVSTTFEANKKQKTTKETKTLTTFTLGLRPSLKQRKALELQIRVTNHTYNWCVWLVQEKGKRVEELQSIVVTNKQEKVPSELRMSVNLKTDKGEWVTEEDMRRGDDNWYFQPVKCSTCSKLTALKRFKSNFVTAKKKYGPKATMKYRIETTDHQADGVFGVQKAYVKWVDERHLEIMPSVIAGSLVRKGNEGDRKIRANKMKHKVPPIEHDVTVVKRPNGKFVIAIPCEPKWTRSAKSNIDCQNICGIDPGVRTFMTGVDCSDGTIFEFGKQEEKKNVLQQFHIKEDEIRSLMVKARSKGKKLEEESRGKQLKKLLYKRKQKIDMLHRHVIAYLVKKYRLVSLGKLDVKSIVRTDKNRKINSTVARDAYAWSHFKFRMKLIERTEGSDCKVIVQEETFTSKTCCRCNSVKNELGGNEIYNCDKCNFTLGRDVNGAINILRKTLKSF
jgi:transposase